MENITRDDFLAQSNTKFKVYLTPENAVEAELAEVSEMRNYPRQKVFSLIFLLPPDAPIEQRMYKMEHPALGELDIFLAPLERTENGVKFEAVFNRLADE